VEALLVLLHALEYLSRIAEKREGEPEQMRTTDAKRIS
jgi:hypothetical protein